MMLAISAFSLILPAFRGVAGGAISALALVALALAGGVMFIHFLGQFIYPLQSQEVHESKNQTRAWLFVTAMMIHNFPEGLASGASLNVENAMLFVSSKELWAQSQGHPERVVWKPSFAVGFLLMASMSLFSF